MSQDEGTSFFERERDKLSGEITAVGNTRLVESTTSDYVF